MSENHDTALRASLRAGLMARDRSASVRPFAAVWPAAATRVARPALLWRAVGATFASIVAVAVIWSGFRQSGSPDPARVEGGIDMRLAHRLSSSGFWRVPTDELLTFAAPPLSAELPTSADFQISLEDSLL